MTSLSRLLLPLAVIQPAALHAAETVLYGPAPGWAVRSALPAAQNSGPPILLFDYQQRIDGDTLSVFSDSATRIATPEQLTQMANVALPWLPDKGDITIHELAITRGAERIDLLEKGQKFTVLRREESMERLELTGQLTASLAVEGLRVGDVLRLAYTQTARDGALGGHVQNVAPLLSAPAPVQTGRVRLSWPKDRPLAWRALSGSTVPKPVVKSGWNELEIPVPGPKLEEVPDDAPARFRPLPLVELSTFGNWSEVASVMAPLYATEGLIAAGSPLDAEVTRIMKAEPSAVGRAAAALRLVQDQVRYLAVMMDGGNYVPQKPERTWELRYGDCKAKSLLLLAMLRAMNIEAEAVLVSAQLSDWVPKRLPSAAAFDHVIVRAVIDGTSLWLDGTRTGTRLADIWDTPAFKHALPLRASGVTLIPIELRKDARPTLDVEIEADETTSIDLPSVLTVSATVRGGLAGQVRAVEQLPAEQRRQFAQGALSKLVAEGQWTDIGFRYDNESGAATITGRGAITSPWSREERETRRDPLKLLPSLGFDPDRSRTAWTGIPIATGGPGAMRWRARIRLPEGGRNFVLEGELDLSGRLAGRDLTRKVTLADGVLTVEERMDETGAELPVAEIAAEREKVAAAKSHAPRVLAPADARRRWDLGGKDPTGATQIKALEDVFAKAIAADPDEVTGYTSRAGFRTGIGNRAGALADYDKAVALSPTLNLYLSRASTHEALGNLKAALADAEAARKLDPSSVEANGMWARLKAESGDLKGALAVIDERLASGAGETRSQYRRARADLLGEYGDPAEAIRLLDEAIEERPGSPSLLNARCWIKGTRSVALDTALKDCTNAVELADNPAPSLDSRAMVWFRMGKYEEALRDLDAALASSPSIAAARYMRGLTLAKLSRAGEGKRELDIARSIWPPIDREYERYGLRP